MRNDAPKSLSTRLFTKGFPAASLGFSLGAKVQATLIAFRIRTRHRNWMEVREFAAHRRKAYTMKLGYLRLGLPLFASFSPERCFQRPRSSQNIS